MNLSRRRRRIIAAQKNQKGFEATEAARQLADDNGIDLATVTGTGAGGRIIKSDITALIDS